MKRYSDLQTLVAEKAGIGRGHWVLDAGTGPRALLAIHLAEFVGDEGRVIAVDYEREYISAIKYAIIKSGFSERISFLVADLRYTPIRDCSIDAAVSLDTIQNMYGNGIGVEEVIKRYIIESARIVKPGRKVVVGTRHPVPRNKAQEAYLELFLFESQLEYVLWEQQARFYFEYELVSWLKKASLKEVKAEIIEHNIPYPRDIERFRAKIDSLIIQVKPSAERVRLEEEFRRRIKTVEKYGEEWLPTLLLTGTKE